MAEATSHCSLSSPYTGTRVTRTWSGQSELHHLEQGHLTLDWPIRTAPPGTGSPDLGLTNQNCITWSRVTWPWTDQSELHHLEQGHLTLDWPIRTAPPGTGSPDCGVANQNFTNKTDSWGSDRSMLNPIIPGNYQESRGQWCDGAHLNHSEKDTSRSFRGDSPWG